MYRSMHPMIGTHPTDYPLVLCSIQFWHGHGVEWSSYDPVYLGGTQRIIEWGCDLTVSRGQGIKVHCMIRCACVTLVGALGDGVLDGVLSGQDTDECLWSFGACVAHDISSSKVYSGTLLSNPLKTGLNRIIVRSCVSMCPQCGSSKDVRVCRLFSMATTHT